MSSTTEQIKDRLGIAEVVGSYIKLEKAGKNLKACCPFHNEKSPSFIVSPDRGTFYCFGCGKKGDIFSFIQEYEGLEFVDSMKLLADKAGIEIKFDKGAEKSTRNEDKDLLNKATKFYEDILQENNDAKKYLKERGVTEEDIKKWMIGLSQDTWSSLHDYFKSLGETEEGLDRVGLIKKGEKGNWYDRFRSRIMFPLSDATGSIVGFTGRIIKGDEKQAKYVNSPETELFNKSRILYGYHLAKGPIRKNNFSILVEGQFDVIAAHRMGYTNTVATSGTALTDEQLTLLNRISPRIVLALDADGAGFKASERAWQMALSKGMDVKIAKIPEGKDPADLALESPDKWKEVVKGAKHIIDFLAEKIVDDNLTGRDLALKIHESLIPYISKIESAVEQSHFVEKIATRFSIDKNALWREVTNTSKPDKERVENLTETREIQNVQKSVEKQLLGIVLWQKSLESPSIDGDDLRLKVEKLIGEDSVIALERSIDIEAIIFATEEAYDNDKLLKESIEELLIRLERAVLEARRSKLKQALKREELSEKDVDDDEILKELNEVSKKIESLNLRK